jgi:Co/Zn/Cd efflux system component
LSECSSELQDQCLRSEETFIFSLLSLEWQILTLKNSQVIGDALGNVGVIVSALTIWLTSWSGRFYADPAVSLFITLIILKSTIPLTSATAKILLQATPDHIDVKDIKEDIQDIPGVLSM